MKKRIIMILSILLIGLSIVRLYQTFAISTLVSENSDNVMIYYLLKMMK